MEKNRLFWTSIYTFSAFCAGYTHLPLINAPFIDRECRTYLHTSFTRHAFFLIDPHFKDIHLVGERLEGAEGTEETTLSSSFCEDRQNNDKGNKKTNKDYRLYKNLY